MTEPLGDKAMTLRLDVDQAAVLEMVATVDGQPMSAVLRAAILEHIQTRRADPEFQQRLRRVFRENEAALTRLRQEPTDD